MIPTLYEYNAREFSSHGIGDLVDMISCESIMTDEGEYELSFEYPVTGALFHELTIGRIVVVKANPWQGRQLFRIYGYEKQINGIITVNCQHISYDLANIPVRPFKALKKDNGSYPAVSEIFETMMRNHVAGIYDADGSIRLNEYQFNSDLDGPAHIQDEYFRVESPTSLRAVLLDGDESLKGCYGGDLVFDNRNISLLRQAGEDRGIVIEYGVDLMDLNQETNISEMVTGVYPYFRYSVQNQQTGEHEDAYTYGNIQYASGTFATQRVIPLDLTEHFPDQAEGTSPDPSELEAKAREWMAAEEGFGEPEVNLTISYASLGQDVRLHDAVEVRFVKLGIATETDSRVKSKVTSYKYDVLNERPIEVQIGKTKRSVLFSLEDASRLRKGLLPPSRIKDKSITSEKYATGSVRGGGGGGGSSKKGGALAKDGVLNENIAQSAVDTKQLALYAVKSDRIGNGEIYTINIQDDQVSADKLTYEVRNILADVIDVKTLVAGVVDSAGRVTASTIICQGHQYTPMTFSIIDGNGNQRSCGCLATFIS